MARIFYRTFPSLHRDMMRVCAPFPYSPYNDLSVLETIVVLLEDRRFFQHKGIDWRSWVRELWRFFTFQKHGGASTIDMQFVRTQTGYKQRTLRRKLYEMLLAYLLQSRMNKIAILRSYMGIVYLGSGIYGTTAAAQKIFGKEIYEIDRMEASLIAAMMVYPRPLSPTDEWEDKVARRAEYGLKLFEKFGTRYRRKTD